MYRVLLTKWTGCLALALAWGMAASASAAAGEVEVLHWWTSSGEARAVAVLKTQLQRDGHVWRYFAVTGGGGASDMTLFKSRALSHNASATAQIKGAQLLAYGMAVAQPTESAVREVVSSSKTPPVFPSNKHKPAWSLLPDFDEQAQHKRAVKHRAAPPG